MMLNVRPTNVYQSPVMGALRSCLSLGWEEKVEKGEEQNIASVILSVLFLRDHKRNGTRNP